MNISNRWLPAIAIVATLIAGCSREEVRRAEKTPAAAPTPTARVVHVYNWADYIDPAVVEEFEKTTGIKVTLDVLTLAVDGHARYQPLGQARQHVRRVLAPVELDETAQHGAVAKEHFAGRYHSSPH